MRIDRSKIAAGLLSAFLVACGGLGGSGGDDSSGGGSGGSNEETSDESDDTDEVGSLAISGNALATSYPEGLAVTALPQAIDETPGEAAPGTLKIETGETALYSDDVFYLIQDDQQQPPPGDQPGSFDDQKRHPKDVLKDAKDRLAGDADSCFKQGLLQTLDMRANNFDVCYGFDYAIISGTAMGTKNLGEINDVRNQISETDDQAAIKAKFDEAFSDLTSSEEACMVSSGRVLINQNGNKLQAALELFQGMLCQAKKDELASELPAIDETLDLKDTLANAVNDNDPNKPTFTQGDITRIADHNGRPRFKSVIKLTTSGAEENETEIVLIHSPGTDGNDTYDGVLYINSERSNEGAVGPAYAATSMAYARTGTTFEDQNLKLEVRSGVFSKDIDAPLFDAEGRLDYNAGTDDNNDFPGGNNAAGGFVLFSFDVNPSTYEGKIAYWNNPGATYSEPPRGFVFETTQQDDGSLKGCAYAGAEMDQSIRKSFKEDKTLSINGCYTPDTKYGACSNGGNPNPDNIGTNVFIQCFAQDTEGLYKLDLENIDDDTAGFDIKDKDAATIPTVTIDIPGVGEI